jgi:undecaprenyl-diphosphatase
MLPTSVDAHDRAIFEWVARRHSPPLDAVLPLLGNSANFSRIWIVLGIAVAMLGGRRGSHAAKRGFIALGIASAIVNGPLKWWTRRVRPDAEIIPMSRRIRTPRTTSFPSGHSATAAAFATAICLEYPKMLPIVAPLAAGVAVSRVYTGVHYPTDVLVGSALGVAAALATHREHDA